MNLSKSSWREGASILVYLIVSAFIIAMLSSIVTFVGATSREAIRRVNLIKAAEVARGVAVFAASDLDRAITHPVNDLHSYLTGCYVDPTFT